MPPPQIHRHRYFGVLAPHSPRCSAVTALARAATTPLPAPKPQPAAEPAHRRAARYVWTALLARIYEVFPLVCPLCGAEMRVIAFITDPPTIHDIHLGEPTAPPRIGARPRPAAMESARCRAGQRAASPDKLYIVLCAQWKPRQSALE